MPLAVPTDRAIRSTPELRTLVRAIRDAPPEEMEQDWVDWKAAEKLLAKVCLVDIARHIIGFANRQPDHAATVAEGCAYLLIGVEPGRLASADVIDIAQLDQGLGQYLSSDGPRWSANYVDVEGHKVLVLTIEAPRWGDPIHCLQTAYHGNDRKKSYEAGAVFLRRNGRTSRPDPAALAMLQDRLLRSVARLDLGVSWTGAVTPTIVALHTGSDALRDWLDTERRRLLAPVVADEQYRALYDSDSLVARIEYQAYRAAASHFHSHSILTGMEQRSPVTYRAEVENYLTQAEARLPAKVWALAVEKIAPALVLAVTNGTDRNFTGVQVEIVFAGAVKGYVERYDAWKGIDFPRAPTLYGTVKPITDVFGDYSSIQRSNDLLLRRTWADNAPGRCQIRFAPIDLRPHYSVRLPSFCLLGLPEAVGTTITGTWHATATSADGLIEGSLAVSVDPLPESAAAVLAEKKPDTDRDD